MTNRKAASEKRDGTAPTSRHLNQMLPKLLEKIGRQYQERPDLVMASWPQVVGPHLASMTKVVSFREGVLFVKVNNSSLFAILEQYDKPRIIKNLRDKFPKTLIKTVLFRLG